MISISNIEIRIDRMKDMYKEFMEKMCPSCHRECVTKSDVNECMLAYNDFVDDYLEEELK